MTAPPGAPMKRPKLIGSDFVEQTAPRLTYCSECARKIPAGEVALVSLKYGKVQKRVCSEDCRLEFDARFWDEIADEHEREGRAS